MIIFQIIWFIIELWFDIFTFVGACIGFLVGLGLAVSLIAFGIELLRDKWYERKYAWLRKPKNTGG